MAPLKQNGSKDKGELKIYISMPEKAWPHSSKKKGSEKMEAKTKVNWKYIGIGAAVIGSFFLGAGLMHLYHKKKQEGKMQGIQNLTYDKVMDSGRTIAPLVKLIPREGNGSE